MPFEHIRLPADDSSVDLIVAQSVFTHMLAPTFEHYMREFSRILRPHGVAYATCFRVSDDILHVARAIEDPTFDLRFLHDLGDGCYVEELDFLIGAVGYTDEAFARMIEPAGLRFVGRSDQARGRVTIRLRSRAKTSWC